MRPEEATEEVAAAFVDEFVPGLLSSLPKPKWKGLKELLGAFFARGMPVPESAATPSNDGAEAAPVLGAPP